MKHKHSKAIILAAGLGSRMRRADAASSLTDKQAAIADDGLKALIPIDRPFLDYSLTNIAEAGYRHICLVISPRQDRVREYYSNLDCQHLEFEFAIQHKQLGTADALAAAADFAGNDPVLVLNCDNYYPTSVLRHLLETDGRALAGFDRQALVKNGNLSSDRLAAFSVLESDDEGYLTNIVEKPSPDIFKQLPEPVLFGMNCWRFGPAIFEACRSIEPSPRGEYELPDAVMYSIRQLGERYRVIPSSDSVLDLSSRDDIESVTARLRDVEVRL